MTKTAVINARIDQSLKAETEAVLDDLGVTTSGLITMLFKQVVRERRIPFEVTLSTTNGLVDAEALSRNDMERLLNDRIYRSKSANGYTVSDARAELEKRL